jgi:predicted nucleic acid-binding protein
VTAFADSSALVKLYVDEADHAKVRRQCDLVVAEIVGVEVPAAFWRKHRTGELDASDARILTAAFHADLFGTATEDPRFVVVSASARVLRDAADLVARHPLRAYEAVQLSCALHVQRAEPSCSTMLTFDAGLARAAAAEGLAVVP